MYKKIYIVFWTWALFYFMLLLLFFLFYFITSLMYFYLQIFSKKKKMKVDPGLDFISELIGVAS
jgi:hypothetical protein